MKSCNSGDSNFSLLSTKRLNTSRKRFRLKFLIRVRSRIETELRKYMADLAFLKMNFTVNNAKKKTINTRYLFIFLIIIFLFCFALYRVHPRRRHLCIVVLKEIQIHPCKVKTETTKPLRSL